MSGAFHEFAVHLRYQPDGIPNDLSSGQLQPGKIAVDTVESAVSIPAAKAVFKIRCREPVQPAFGQQYQGVGRLETIGPGQVMPVKPTDPLQQYVHRT